MVLRRVPAQRCAFGLRRGRSALTLPADAQVVLRGQLRDPTSRWPGSGAIVQLAANEGGDWYQTGVAQTNHNGQFRTALPAEPTRRIAAVYWPTIDAQLPVFSRRLLVRASGRVTLRTTMLTGQRIVYRGRVSGAPIPAGGLLVAAGQKRALVGDRGTAAHRRVRNLHCALSL